MRLLGWTKVPFHTHMKLVLPALEPTSSSRSQPFGLFEFGHAKDLAVKGACGRFAAVRCRNLQMVDAQAGLPMVRDSK
jgi:hypothetical protein